MEFPRLPRAACAGTDPEAFFDTTGHSTEAAFAKRICQSCEEKDPCLEWALRHEEHGLWGGSTAKERRDMRRVLGIKLQAPEVAILGKVGYEQPVET